MSSDATALRVLVDLQKLPGENGGGEVALPYQCARPLKRQVGTMLVPDIENYFETEKLPYKTDEEGEDIMQEHLRYLRRDLRKS
jgi:hypothetical protein